MVTVRCFSILEVWMNVFEVVKQSVTTRQAAECYGFHVNRTGKIICPFHNDKNPSMKVDNRFHCFGCGADGDVIDFVSKLYGVGSLQAAKKLATDFGIMCDSKTENKKLKPIRWLKSDAQKYAEAENKVFRVLSDYYHLLNRWEVQYAPDMKDENWHPRFIEALQKKTHIEYLLDTLIYGCAEEKAKIVMEYGKETIVLEQRISEFNTADAGSSYADSCRDAALQECGRSQRKSGIEREWQHKKQHQELCDRIAV